MILLTIHEPDGDHLDLLVGGDWMPSFLVRLGDDHSSPSTAG
jgi:hypothetical protein